MDNQQDSVASMRLNHIPRPVSMTPIGNAALRFRRRYFGTATPPGNT